MKKKRKPLLLLALWLALALPLAAEGGKRSASAIKNAALRQETAQQSIDYIRSQLDKAATNADRRSLLYYAGLLQEQIGLYADAASSYAQAAAIPAADAANMPKVTNEQLLINAVRACLNYGNYEGAETYLDSSVRSSRTEEIKAYADLYSVWSELCRAQTVAETAEAVAQLREYAGKDGMGAVRPAVLLTLWYLTDEREYGDALQKDFPQSPEAAIVRGSARIMSMPFWYYVPRASYEGAAAVEVNVRPAPDGAASTHNDSATNAGARAQEPAAPAKLPGAAGGRVREQLGLFQNHDYAASLVERVRRAGFDAYIDTETRPSGATYYIVVVDEDADGSVGARLRDAGFDCYPIR